MSLTIAFLTSRKNPLIEYFFDSLSNQVGSNEVEVIVVDFYAEERHNEIIEKFNRAFQEDWHSVRIKVESCKPTIWQGKFAITKEPWWAKSAYHNTAICLTTTDFLAFTDDRVILSPQWLQCVIEAQQGNYAVCGSYEKRSGMKVENGEITDYGECLGVDTRHQYGEPVATRDWYGGSCALPLEWCLAVNGFSEDLCDGLGSEDSMFGVTLRNSGYPMKFDSRMRIIEDRTPSEIEGALKRADKNPHLGQRAKSWDIVRAFHGKTTSQNSFDIRDMRARIQKGEDWREPSASHYDWYDGGFIGDMT